MVNHQFHLKISCVWATASESMFKDAQPRCSNNIRECSKLHNFRIHQYNACGPAGYKMSPIWMELQIGQKRKPHTLAFIYKEHHVHVRLPNGKYYTSVINTKLVYLLCIIAISVICLVFFFGFLVRNGQWLMSLWVEWNQHTSPSIYYCYLIETKFICLSNCPLHTLIMLNVLCMKNLEMTSAVMFNIKILALCLINDELVSLLLRWPLNWF